MMWVMSIVQMRRRFVLGSLVVAAAFLAACGTKEQPSPPPSTQAALPSVAPAPTTTTTTTVPTPPPVWRAARWGMTRAEVLAAFPGEAQRLDPPVAFGPQAPGASDVAIPAYELDGMKFRALFGFEADALNRVHLSAIKAAEATCGDLERLLTEKHTAPSDRSTTQTNLRTEQIVWQRPDQTITLACSEAPGLGYRSVSLDYTAPNTR
jgi:hypothetical protein